MSDAPSTATDVASRIGPRFVAVAALACAATAAAVERLMGRLWLGPDGRFGLWEGSVWSSEQSQRLADPYSFTHVCHGILFCGALWLVARKLPLRLRYLAAAAIESCWEILENSPWVLARYRATTIELGYMGDSILNSMSDIGMMSLGFLLASRVGWKLSVALVIVMELGLAFTVRDNLTLNVVMLVHPPPAVRAWQEAARPPNAQHTR